MNKQSSRTLSGTIEVSADIVDLPSSDNAIRVNGFKGTVGQLLGKNRNTNKLEFRDEVVITGTPPIVVADGAVSLNTNMGDKSLTTTGTLTTGILTASGNINANGNIVGDGTTDISSIADIGCANILVSANIEANGNIVGDDATDITGIADIGCVNLINSGNIQANGNITGDTSTFITQISSISTTNIAVAGNLFANGVIKGDDLTTMTGINTISLVDADSHLDLNGGAVIDLDNITYKDVASTFTGNSSNKVVFTQCDFSSATNTQGDAVIPSVISGNKVFTGHVEINGDTELGNGNLDTTLITGSLEHYIDDSTTDRYKSLTNYKKTMYHLTDASKYEYDTNILNMTYQAPFSSTRLSQSTTNANNFPYRVIKFHPTEFLQNDDHSYYNFGVYDTLGTGNAPTTGTSAVGGVKVHTTGLEIWKYFDVPEGMSLEAVFLRISNTAGSAFVGSERLKVWSKETGIFATDMTKMVELIDEDISTSTSTNTYQQPNLVGGGAGTIYEQDLISTFQRSMVMRVHLDSTSNIFMGGYGLCRPSLDLRYKLTIIGGAHTGIDYTLFFVGSNGEISSGTFTAASQTKIIYFPYDYGFNFTFAFTLSAQTSGQYYDLDGVSQCLIGDNTSLGTSDENWNGGGTKHIKFIRQEATFNIEQKSTPTTDFTKFTLTNEYMDGISNIKIIINGMSKTHDDGTSKEYKYEVLGSQTLFNLNTAYPMTATTSAGGAVSGFSFAFGSANGCSFSSSSWNGDNSSPITVTFTSAICDAEFSVD